MLTEFSLCGEKSLKGVPLAQLYLPKPLEGKPPRLAKKKPTKHTSGKEDRGNFE